MGCALSSTLSCLNHSCAPNAAIDVSEGYLTVRALKDIGDGEEITISYVDTALSVEQRQAILRDHYCFECVCSRCAGEMRGGRKAPGANG